MKVKVFDIHAEGLDLKAEIQNDPWWKALIHEAFNKLYRAKDPAQLTLQIVKACETVRVTGTAEVDLFPTCNRCADEFSTHLSIPIDLVFSPGEEGEKDEEGEGGEDVSFGFYSGNEIDLSEALRETLMLATPFLFHCWPDCKGICPRCGTNWNHAVCVCGKESKSKMKKTLVAFFAGILLFCSIQLSAEEKKNRFFVGGGPHAGVFLKEIKRPGIGLGFRGGYQWTEDLKTSLLTDWSYTYRHGTSYHFFDFAPYVSYDIWRDLYLFAGGGLTVAISSQGSAIRGFDRVQGVTRVGYLAGGGVGKILIQGSGLAVGMELAGMYRRIKQARIYEPALRAFLTYEF